MVTKKTATKPKSKAKTATPKVAVEKTLETPEKLGNRELLKAAYKLSPIGTIVAATSVTLLVLHAACYIFFI